MGLSDLLLRASDGYDLGATLFTPSATARAAVLVMPAAGVPQRYYARFAAYLTARGFAVLTFDYRGIGRSRHGSPRRLQARMRDWALLDAAAAFLYLDSYERIAVVGHSFGGQALGLLPQPERIAAALVVGSQSGYWKNWPPLGRAWMWPVTHFLLPGIASALGYFPASRLGFGEDLPAGVAIEWARWCRHPRYLVGALQAEAAYARFRAPLLAYAITDDPFAPLPAVKALFDLYPFSQPELRPITPRSLDVKTIGHFGFFREPFRDTLWRDAADWLETQDRHCTSRRADSCR